MRVFLKVFLILAAISIGKYVSGDCMFGTNSFAACDFAPWSRWNCNACCLDNQDSLRRRDLCCGNTLAVSLNDINTCYNGCNKIYGVDNIDKKPCSTVCTCSTSTSSTTPLSTPSCVCPLPTASSTTSSATSSTNSPTSSTRISTTASSTASSISASSSSLTPPTRKASLICFEGKDDIYKCGPRCKDSADWDVCIRSCTRELYETVCQLVSVSLFILGVIVGTLCTCVINFICKTRKKKLQRRVTPNSAESPDRSPSMISEESDSDFNYYFTKLKPW